MNDITVMAISIDEEQSAFPDLVLNMDELPNTNELLDILDYPHVDQETVDSTCLEDFGGLKTKLLYGPPPRTPFEGDYGFTVEVSSKDTNKKRYLYSDILNSLYVNMMDKFPVHYNWDASRLGTRARVRATVVFTDAAEAEKRVERCVQHLHERRANDDNDLRQSIVPHVLQSSREPNTPGVQYCGDPNVPNSWYSVVVEMNKPGAEPCSHAYRFACKTSCSSGINRRATSIIFTLEDQNGLVLGRQMVGVRVCACPRRDMLKDERSVDKVKQGKRRVSSRPADLPFKRVKTEAPAVDDLLLVLPQSTSRFSSASPEMPRRFTVVSMTLTSADDHLPKVASNRYADHHHRTRSDAADDGTRRGTQHRSASGNQLYPMYRSLQELSKQP